MIVHDGTRVLLDLGAAWFRILQHIQYVYASHCVPYTLPTYRLKAASMGENLNLTSKMDKLKLARGLMP